MVNSTLTPRAGRRPRLDTSIDVAQQKLDDMMLFNSQKRKSLYTTQKPRVPAKPMYSPSRRSEWAQPGYSRRGYFDELDYIRDQINKIWFKHDINRSGALDKMEVANFLKDFCAAQGKPAPNMQTYHRFFYEFDKNRDGLIQRNEMARFIKKYLDSKKFAP